MYLMYEVCYREKGVGKKIKQNKTKKTPMTSAKRGEQDFYETHLKEIGKNGEFFVDKKIWMARLITDKIEL